MECEIIHTVFLRARCRCYRGAPFVFSLPYFYHSEQHLVDCIDGKATQTANLLKRYPTILYNVDRLGTLKILSNSLFRMRWLQGWYCICPQLTVRIPKET